MIYGQVQATFSQSGNRFDNDQFGVHFAGGEQSGISINDAQINKPGKTDGYFDDESYVLSISHMVTPTGEHHFMISAIAQVEYSSTPTTANTTAATVTVDTKSGQFVTTLELIGTQTQSVYTDYTMVTISKAKLTVLDTSNNSVRSHEGVLASGGACLLYQND